MAGPSLSNNAEGCEVTLKAARWILLVAALHWTGCAGIEPTEATAHIGDARSLNHYSGQLLVIGDCRDVSSSITCDAITEAIGEGLHSAQLFDPPESQQRGAADYILTVTPQTEDRNQVLSAVFFGVYTLPAGLLSFFWLPVQPTKSPWLEWSLKAELRGAGGPEILTVLESELAPLENRWANAYTMRREESKMISPALARFNEALARQISESPVVRSYATSVRAH